MEPYAISVIIPTYNRAPLVRRAVASALAATVRGDEVIVVDDGSTDCTAEALAPYRGQIRYVRTPNAGVGAARNRGVCEARCPLIAFLDSDDLWTEDKLLLQRMVLQAYPEVVFCCTDFADLFEDGTEQHRRVPAWWRHPRVGCLGEPPTWGDILGPGVQFSSLAGLPIGRHDFQVYVGDLYPFIMEAACVLPSTAVVRPGVAGERLRFPEDLPTYEDWECFGRSAGAGPVAYLDCETAWQYAHRGPRLTDAGALGCAAARIAVLTRVWGADAAFLARHGARYRRVLGRQHLTRMWRLLERGRPREALAALRRAEGATFWDGVLAALPRQLAGRLMNLRRINDARSHV